MSPTKAEMIAFAVRLDEYAKEKDCRDTQAYKTAAGAVFALTTEYPTFCGTPRACAMAGRCVGDPVCNS